MRSVQHPWLVFTDLDGTLLDHHTYHWQPAAPWLAALRRHNIPVVICSSKTPAEIRELQPAIGLSGAPFIAENGAVISLPDSPDSAEHTQILAAMTTRDIVSMLATLAPGYRFRGFHTAKTAHICQWTGLAPAQASLAMDRMASLTLLWQDSPENLQDFTTQVAHLGLRVITGGRFLHVVDARTGKGAAAAQVTQWYAKQEGKSRITLGLGDAPNDVDLLNQTDYAVLVKGRHSSLVTLENDHPDRVYRTTSFAPTGWGEGLDHFISLPA